MTNENEEKPKIRRRPDPDSIKILSTWDGPRTREYLTNTKSLFDLISVILLATKNTPDFSTFNSPELKNDIGLEHSELLDKITQMLCDTSVLLSDYRTQLQFALVGDSLDKVYSVLREILRTVLGLKLRDLAELSDLLKKDTDK